MLVVTIGFDILACPDAALLREFSYTAGTERLFDRVASRWRLLGPVTMIAAPDVTSSTIDPGDYLRWITRRVDELFVTTRASLDNKLAALDQAPDTDGRFRITEFCCRDSTTDSNILQAAFGKGLNNVRVVSVRRGRDADRGFEALADLATTSSGAQTA